MGKVFSEERLRNMSLAQKGIPKPRTVAHQQALIESRRRGCGWEHSEASKLKMSLSRRGVRRGPPAQETRDKIAAALRGRPLSAAHGDKIRQSNIRRAAITKRHPYNGIEFRSAWEVRVAKAFDALGMPWQYEPRRFFLGRRSYLPDFYLPNEDVWWEVKGYFPRSGQKLIADFRRGYPDRTLVIATLPVIEMLEQTVRRAAA
jgi:hypothetical protein